MDINVVNQAKALSIEVIREAGKLVRDLFGRGVRMTEKDDHGDVVTEADRLSEATILNSIRSAFPEHQIHSEEARTIGAENDWLWLIDPLDGTNNYAIGLPVFAISITLLYRREPALGVVYEPLTDRLFVAARGEGATCNGQPMRMAAKTDFAKGNIGWIQGHRVRQDPIAVRLRQHIDVSFKRMLRLWAPTLVWCMLANGDIDGIVLYDSEGDDLYSGLLMVKEAGGSVIDFEGKPFEGMNNEPYIIACHPEHQERLLRVVREGLSE